MTGGALGHDGSGIALQALLTQNGLGDTQSTVAIGVGLLATHTYI